MEQPPTEAPRPGRDARIDLFRGLALLTIFVDHIEGNPWSALTIREFGAVTALDVFVVLAGVSGYLAYGSRLRRGGDGLRRIGHRIAVVYLAQLGLIAAMLAFVLVVDQLVPDVHAVTKFHAKPYLTDPAGSLLETLLMTARPHNSGILTLYVLLLATLPLIVWTLRRALLLPVAVGAVLFLGSVLAGWHIPQSHSEVEPLQWVLVYAAGVTLAAAGDRRRLAVAPTKPPWVGRVATAAALTWLVLMAVDDAPWQAVPRWSGAASPLAAMGLSLQGDVVSELLRPLGLAAMVWLVLRWVPRDAGWLGARWVLAVAAVGRHSLPIFVGGVLLSSLVTVLALVAGGSAAVYALLTLAGIALHLVVATHWPRRRASGLRRMPQHLGTSAEGLLEPVGERVRDRPPPGVEHDVVGDAGQDDGPGVVRRSGGADLRDGEHGVVLPADHE